MAEHTPLTGQHLRQALSSGVVSLDQLYRNLGLDAETGWLRELLDARRTPTQSELMRLAAHSGVPLTVLAGVAQPNESLAVALRAGLLDGALDVEPQVARAQRLIAHLRLLESWYRTSTNHRFMRGKNAIRSRSHDTFIKRSAQITAQQLRAILDLSDTEPVLNLSELVESLGVPVFVTHLPDRVHGITVHDSSDSKWRGVIFVHSGDWWTRQRYTLAHELAHVIFQDNQPVIVDRAGSIDERDKVEWRAECFARYFLAPDSAVRSFWARHAREGDEIALAKLMMHFGISRDAAARAISDAAKVPSDRLRPLLSNEVRVRELMESAGLGDLWAESCHNQHEEGVSSWLLELALNAYREGLISPNIVADILNEDDVSAVISDLYKQGWASART